MRRLLLAFVALLFTCVLAAAAYVGYEGYSFLKKPPQSPGQDVTVTVAPGETFYQVAEKLHAQNVITNVQYFRILAKHKGVLSSIQAGEFKLSTGWAPGKVLETLVKGKPILYKLAIREGLTWWETAKLVEKAGYADFDAFAAAIKDPQLLKKYHIPFKNAEGFLFPETYHLKKPTGKDAKMVAEVLVKMFWKQAAAIWPGVANKENKQWPADDEIKKMVILASLVEKETGAPPERARIAGVYAQRLKRKMLLQCDPTIIYGLGTSFDGNLRRKHLNDPKNPYNTYQHAGLPPGPICSPGLDALKAAAKPEEHKFLYFVSKGDGTHYFSKSLREHNNAVRKYQLKRRKK